MTDYNKRTPPPEINERVEIQHAVRRPNYRIIEHQDKSSHRLYVEHYPNDIGFERYYIDVPYNLKEIQRIRNSFRDEYSLLRNNLIQKKYRNEKIDYDEIYFSIAVLGNSFREKLTETNAIKTNELWEKIFDRTHDNPGVIEMSSDNFILPFEYLVHLIFSESKEENYIDGFLKVKYHFRKIKNGDNPNPKSIVQQPRVLYLYSNTLINEENKEFIYLKTLASKDKIKLIPKCEADFKGKRGFVNTINEEDADVVHVSCHVKTEQEHESRLIFRDFTVTKNDVRMFRKGVENKMIFLNGCITDNSDVEVRDNFVTELLNSKVSSLITVDVRIPEVIASEFANEFYTSLTQNSGNGIDSLVHKSLVNIRKNFDDMGGYFYSAYLGETKN